MSRVNGLGVEALCELLRGSMAALTEVTYHLALPRHGDTARIVAAVKQMLPGLLVQHGASEAWQGCRVDCYSVSGNGNAFRVDCVLQP